MRGVPSRRLANLLGLLGLAVPALAAVAVVAFAQTGTKVNVVDPRAGRGATVGTNNALSVNVLSLPAGGGMSTVNQGSPNSPANAWPVVPYPAPVGSQGNAWNSASVAANGTSATVDFLVAPFVDAFGTATSATTISLQVSQDGVHFYVTDSITLSGAGDFGFHVELGSRYARLKSSAATVITATLAGKT